MRFQSYLLLIVVLVLNEALAKPPHNAKAVTPCDEATCTLPDCQCSTTSHPTGLDTKQIPQFVFFTFDDAVEKLNHDDFYVKAFYNKTNPDGCPISSTYFLSHEYSDYSMVNDLYVNGHEIALHSISHSTDALYWRNMTKDELTREFGDEKALVSHFANIPIEAFEGMRLPHLQQSGSNSYEVGHEIGLKYDCSWPTQHFIKPGMWPYTLDYESTQDCPIGPCPNTSVPGFWVIPMIDWIDQKNVVCSMVDGCANIPTETEEIVDWFKDNFKLQYETDRAPFGFYVHSAWFSTAPNHFDAYLKFIDYLQTLNDVYIVSISAGLRWLQNPVPLNSSDWTSCNDVQDLGGCKNPQNCQLDKNGETRYMTVCTDSCPEVYPWLGNPYGNQTNILMSGRTNK